MSVLGCTASVSDRARGSACMPERMCASMLSAWLRLGDVGEQVHVCASVRVCDCVCG